MQKLQEDSSHSLTIAMSDFKELRSVLNCSKYRVSLNWWDLILTARVLWILWSMKFDCFFAEHKIEGR